MDEEILLETLNADEISCILAAAYLQIKQDPIEELRFEQMDALCTYVSIIIAT